MMKIWTREMRWLPAMLALLLAIPAWAAPRDAALERVDAERVVLTWTGASADAGATYLVRMATAPEAVTKAAPQRVPARQERLEIRHPEGQRPYVEIEDAAGARKLVAERVLPLEGGINFRDLGGYTTPEGASVRWGKLFRSGDNSQLTDADYDYLRRLGIRTVCDFRANDERGRSPTRAERFGEGVSYVAWDYAQVIEGDEFGAALRESRDPAATATELMTGFYRQMPDLFADRYRTVFDTLKSGDGMLFQCSAGKDRTGLMAALLLGALGVERTQIFADYDLSNHVEGIRERHTGDARHQEQEDPAMAMFSRLPPEAIEAFMGVQPVYLQAAFDAIEADYGSLEGYLDKALGVSAADLQALRARYLVPGR